MTDQNLKKTVGQISVIDQEKHTLVITDITGISHPFRYIGILRNYKGEPYQKGSFVSAVGEPAGEDVYMLIEVRYIKRPADWPSVQKYHKGGSYAPRSVEERREIVRQSCLKVAAEIYLYPFEFFTDDVKKTLTFEETMDRITTAAIKAAHRLMTEEYQA